jgi:hypothetical protein
MYNIAHERRKGWALSPSYAILSLIFFQANFGKTFVVIGVSIRIPPVKSGGETPVKSSITAPTRTVS